MWGCGLRIGEALGLTDGDVRDSDTLRVTGKGGKQRLVPVLPVVAEAIAAYRDACPYVRSADQPLRSLKVLPGVASNNELSSQYSVRGGGYNENLLFLNGFEVFLPFRPRQGEQEGLSLQRGLTRCGAVLAEQQAFVAWSLQALSARCPGSPG